MKLEELKNLKIEITDEMLDRLNAYASFLVEYNEKINLTAITDYEEIIEKHFFDSLLMTNHHDIKGTLVDVGTGAGFPGMVLKICLPELKVKLIEPIKKRCVFLEELINRLGLRDIEVINERGEDYSLKHREEYDFVTARAVTNMNGLIEVCGAMVKVDGYFIALRGKDGYEELNNASKAIKTMGFKEENTFEEHLSDGSIRVIGYLKKVKKTELKYPRKYSIIKQKPL